MTNGGGYRIAAHAHIHLAPRAVAVKYTEMSTDSASPTLVYSPWVVYPP